MNIMIKIIKHMTYDIAGTRQTKCVKNNIFYNGLSKWCMYFDQRSTVYIKYTHLYIVK